MTKNLKSFFIDQHGCAKNQTDGELISAFLEKEGFSQVFDADKADFILINSCGFINSAKKESIDAVYNVKAAYPAAKIILTGCLAQRYANDLFDSMPELDGVFGNGDLSKIAGFMKKVSGGQRFVQTFDQCGISSAKRTKLMNFKGSAFVKITEGCSNHCSFCAIPLIRGELRSRPVESIISEIKELTGQGVYEINLIGQDLAAYGSGEEDKELRAALNPVRSPLCQLLEKISQIQGDFVVRLLYIHPDHFNTDILGVMKKDKRFLHYFDIPFQSGDDKTILAMNRTGSQKKYIELVEKIRSELPDCMLRTTFLTGFPGESDQAAENTQAFLKAIAPDWSGCFPYSREEDTPAYSMKPRVAAKTAQARADALVQLQTEITNEKLTRFAGQTVNVLVEEVINAGQASGAAEAAGAGEGGADSDGDLDPSEGLAIGRAWFQAPEVDGSVVVRYDLDDSCQSAAIAPGNVIKVQILASTGVDLDARFIELVKEFPKDSDLHFIS